MSNQPTDVKDNATPGTPPEHEPLERLIQQALSADPAQAAAADATLKARHAHRLLQTMASPQVSTQVLTYLARASGWPEPVRAAAVSHPHFPAAQVQELLRAPDPEARGLLLKRAERHRDFDLLSAIQSHPQTAPELQKRAEDLMVDVLAAQAAQQGPIEEDLGGSQGEGQSDAGATTARDTTIQRLSKMTVGEKLRVALFGGKEERFILVKSVNRIIATAVLKSPKTGDSDVELISQLRNVHLDVITTITNTPKWAKKRTIALNLIRNPRTPVALSLRLLKSIPPRDLQVVARDRGISEILRKTASRAMAAANRNT